MAIIVGITVIGLSIFGCILGYTVSLLQFQQTGSKHLIYAKQLNSTLLKLVIFLSFTFIVTISVLVTSMAYILNDLIYVPDVDYLEIMPRLFEIVHPAHMPKPVPEQRVVQGVGYGHIHIPLRLAAAAYLMYPLKSYQLFAVAFGHAAATSMAHFIVAYTLLALLLGLTGFPILFLDEQTPSLVKKIISGAHML